MRISSIHDGVMIPYIVWVPQVSPLLRDVGKLERE